MFAIQRILANSPLFAADLATSSAGTLSVLARSLSTQPTPSFATLNSRAVVLLEGKGAADFLQGLVTNDVAPLKEPGCGPVYAALLTPKGKFLHDLFAYSASAAGPSGDAPLLLDVDLGGKGHLLQWLTRYKLRRPLQLEDVSECYKVHAAWGCKWPEPKDMWHSDPRLPQLGYRTVAPQDGTQGVPGAEALVSISPPEGFQEVPESQYQMLRYQLGVPEGDKEMPTEKVNPLEFNLDVLNGVSYTKGCYIGQERNSYTHYRGIVRRRLMPVVLHGEGEGQPGDEVVAAGKAVAIGKIMAVHGQYGLAHLQLATALAAAGQQEGGGSGVRLEVNGKREVEVKPLRPDWWPGEWGTEE